MASPLQILYEDHHILAVMKPARVPVASEDSGDETLLGMVRAWNLARQANGKKGYCVPIHFLDRPVSGVVLFALSSKAATRLNEMFRGRSMQKTYVAVTARMPSVPAATLEHWLAKDKQENRTEVRRAGASDAKKCVLSYKLLANHSGRSLLEVRPVTGRSHQIRAQLAAVHAPLWGDVKYGAASGWDGKIALHAARLDFRHPVGSQEMHILAPVPDYWHEVWSTAFPDFQDIIFPKGEKS
jgi:23S rRNA pseudouridine1911/1915/1917 synthase